jgi:hypothetical protein
MRGSKKELPYVFDLFFDLKTHGQLEQDYNDTRDRLELLERLMRDNNIAVKRHAKKKVW